MRPAMSMGRWFDPPRRMAVLFLGMTLVPSAALLAAGWRLLQQEQTASLRQLAERREQAADFAVSELERVIATTIGSLATPAAIDTVLAGQTDSVRVTFGPDGVHAFPSSRLRSYPQTDAGVEAPADRFANGERLEFRESASQAAIEHYRRLTRSADHATRAGARIRLARALRQSGATGEALAIYAEVAATSGVAIGGIPADLLARWARCDLLDKIGPYPALQAEARALSTDLTSGRWRLSRDVYDLHAADVQRWAGADRDVPDDAAARALASATEVLWQEWRRPSNNDATTGRRALRVDGRLLAVVWSRTDERFDALLAGQSFIDRQWLSAIAPGLDRQGLRLTLREASAPPVSAAEARRLAGETGLPWTVAVEDVNLAGELARVSGRRTVWLWGLGLLVTVTAGGLVILGRSVSRDLALARLQSDFVSAVSHEFRTPLTSMRQLTEVLVDGRVPDAARRETYYRALAHQTERLHRLVESLLDFGRMEAGTSPYRLEWLDAGALVRTIVHEFEQDSAASGHRIELRIHSSDRTGVVADRDALTYAVWNLLDNAVKYSPECPTVWVDVAPQGPHLAIGVRDRGLGVPRHEHTAIFERFVRGHQAKTHGIKGTGIGLAMVRHVVAAHGGDVHVESTPGAGSTFTIVLPLVEPCHAS